MAALMTASEVAAAVRIHPKWSNRRIASSLGLHHSRIAPIRAALVQAGEIAQSSTREGADGRVTDTANTGRNPRPAPLNGGTDLAGQRFGRLVVVEMAGRVGRYIRWVCRCECGQQVTARTGALTNGGTQSCGCYGREVRGLATVTHGASRTREHTAWLNMRQRCTNPRSTAWRHYGGRGISVCERWNSFENFLADMGKAPEGMSLDRIDVNGNYEPGNCRWATATQQARNTRANRVLTFGGQTQTLRAWSEQLGVNYTSLHSRLRHASFDQIVAGLGVVS